MTISDARVMTKENVYPCRAIPPSAGRTIHEPVIHGPARCHPYAVGMPPGQWQWPHFLLLQTMPHDQRLQAASERSRLVEEVRRTIELEAAGTSEETTALLQRIDEAAARLFAIDKDERCAGGSVKAEDRVDRSKARVENTIITIDDTDDEDSEAGWRKPPSHAQSLSRESGITRMGNMNEDDAATANRQMSDKAKPSAISATAKRSNECVFAEIENESRSNKKAKIVSEVAPSLGATSPLKQWLHVTGNQLNGSTTEDEEWSNLVKDYFKSNITNINDRKFLDMVLRLKKVKEATGIAFVESQHGTLGKWCHRQRKELQGIWCYRQRKESYGLGDIERKRASRIQLLNYIGFPWSSTAQAITEATKRTQCATTQESQNIRVVMQKKSDAAVSRRHQSGELMEGVLPMSDRPNIEKTQTPNETIAIVVKKPSKDCKLGLRICQVEDAKSGESFVRVESIAPNGLFHGTRMKVGMRLISINGKEFKEAKDAIDLVMAVEGKLTILAASVVKGAALNETPSNIRTEINGVVPSPAPPSDGKMGNESKFENNDVDDNDGLKSLLRTCTLERYLDAFRAAGISSARELQGKLDDLSFMERFVEDSGLSASEAIRLQICVSKYQRFQSLST